MRFVSILILALTKVSLAVVYEWGISLEDDVLPMIYRSYSPMKADYARIGFNQFFQDYFDEIRTDLKTEERLDALSKKRKNYLLKAKDKGKVVGFAFFRATQPCSYFLEFIAVEPVYKRQGIGRKLTKGILIPFPDTKKITLQTREFNDVAKQFYERLGFKRDQLSPKPGYIGYVWRSF